MLLRMERHLVAEMKQGPYRLAGRVVSVLLQNGIRLCRVLWLHGDLPYASQSKCQPFYDSPF